MVSWVVVPGTRGVSGRLYVERSLRRDPPAFIVSPNRGVLLASRRPLYNDHKTRLKYGRYAMQRGFYGVTF